MIDIAHAVRRALHRAEEGKSLSIDEAEALFAELGFTSEFWRLPR